MKEVFLIEYKFILFGLLLAVLFIFLYIRTYSLERIQKDVYQLFIKAEEVYNDRGQGAQKMNYVFNAAWQLLPKGIRMLISKKTFRMILENWFQLIKDILSEKINSDINDTKKGQ